MFKRRAPQPPSPSRTPHPDPRVEVQLQQLPSLRRAAERNERLLDEHHSNQAHVSRAIARNSGSDCNPERAREIDRLSHEIGRLNAETAELHAQVQELCAKVSDEDLLWLDPRQPWSP